MDKLKESLEVCTRPAWVTPTLLELNMAQTMTGTIPQVTEGLIIGSNPQVFGQS